MKTQSTKPLLPVLLPALLLPAASRAYMEKKLAASAAVAVGGGGAPRPWTRAWRAAKTLFFLLAMLASLLVSSAPPLLVALLDVAFPCAVLVLLADNGTVGAPPLSVGEQLRQFDFRYSLIDLPLVSAARSLLILGVYGLCDGPGRSRGPYLASAMLCSTASAAYVWAKASVFGGRGWLLHPTGSFPRSPASWVASAAVVEGQPVAPESLAVVEALLLGSVVLAAAHAVVAYRTSCRERRKLLVYRIDLEAVSAACKSGLDHHHHIYSK